MCFGHSKYVDPHSLYSDRYPSSITQTVRLGARYIPVAQARLNSQRECSAYFRYTAIQCIGSLSGDAAKLLYAWRNTGNSSLRRTLWLSVLRYERERESRFLEARKRVLSETSKPYLCGFAHAKSILAFY